MPTPPLYLSASEAASQLGVSAKALRLYEQRGLVNPFRTEAGWRAYGPDDMKRAAEVAGLRALGFSLAQVARVVGGDAHGLEQALAMHEAALQGQLQQLARTIGTVRGMRSDVQQGRVPTLAELAGTLSTGAGLHAGFDLPWPWGGERFELRDVRALNYIIGPLGSGKTRLAHCIAEALPGAAFIGLERLDEDADALHARAGSEPGLRARLDQALAWLAEEGGTPSDALRALLCALLAEGPAVLVVDMIEEELDEATQEALVAWLRCHGPVGPRGAGARPVFLLTRSSAILDLAAIGPDETIILCPANHSPPSQVTPCPGAPGYEAVATCLASPTVRSRTAGVIAVRQGADAHPPPAPAAPAIAAG
ncbi:MAG: MerR family transcriptional regulator [Polaromonas sp.]|nr:MerR family transcriptional regulator [Polaromonas sp.]